MSRISRILIPVGAQVTRGQAVKHGSVSALAVALISLGAKLIAEGDYMTGGLLVTIGWVLLVVEPFL